MQLMPSRLLHNATLNDGTGAEPASRTYVLIEDLLPITEITTPGAG